MEYNERFQQYLQAKEIDRAVIERALKHGSRDLEGIAGLNKSATFSLTNTIPKCKDVIQLELVLRIKKYRLKRRHNNLCRHLLPHDGLQLQYYKNIGAL